MIKKDDKTETFGEMEGDAEDIGHSSTVELHRGSFVGEIPSKHRAYMEIISLGDQNEVIELGEKDMHVGRSSRCEIQLEVNNVSRKHVRIAFRNEEYHIEDLGSTNGTYVNGIRVEKCVLRNHDQVEIGGVKILFKEEKTLQTA
ncbi:FHA domain-containing protein [Thermodesulfobacteriota bacterium]